MRERRAEEGRLGSAAEVYEGEERMERGVKYLVYQGKGNDAVSE